MKTSAEQILAVNVLLATLQLKVDEPIDTFGDSANADHSAERAQKDRDQKLINLFRSALGNTRCTVQEKIFNVLREDMSDTFARNLCMKIMTALAKP